MIYHELEIYHARCQYHHRYLTYDPWTTDVGRTIAIYANTCMSKLSRDQTWHWVGLQWEWVRNRILYATEIRWGNTHAEYYTRLVCISRLGISTFNSHRTRNWSGIYKCYFPLTVSVDGRAMNQYCLQRRTIGLNNVLRLVVVKVKAKYHNSQFTGLPANSTTNWKSDLILHSTRLAPIHIKEGDDC